jgi:DNA-binding NarL/FixJ family response regulator
MIRIVLAEDHNVVRQGLKALLDGESDFNIVAETATAGEAVEAVKQFEPDVLVLDWMLPHLSGLEVTRRVSETMPNTHILILSMYADESYVIQALKHGASGYVLKESTGSELIKAIRTCVEGRRFLSPPFSMERLDRYSQKVETGKLDPYQALTNREREVLQRVAEGQTSQEIAEALAISPRTVESHRANMMRKLDLKSSQEVTHYALRKGLISVE